MCCKTTYVIDTTLESDNSSHFGKNLLGRIYKVSVTIDDKINYNRILTEKQQKCLVKGISMNLLQVSITILSK